MEEASVSSHSDFVCVRVRACVFLSSFEGPQELTPRESKKKEEEEEEKKKNRSHKAGSGYNSSTS